MAMTEAEAAGGMGRSGVPTGEGPSGGSGPSARTLLTSLLEPVPELDVVVKEEVEDVALPGTVGERVRWLERIRPDVVR